MSACTERGIALSDRAETRIEEGKGIAGIVEGTRVAIGTEGFVLGEGFRVDEQEREWAERERADGKIITYYGLGGESRHGGRRRE